MSVAMYQNKVNKLRTDIASLNDKLAKERSAEAKKNKDLTSAQRAKSASASSMWLKENKMNRLRQEIAKVQKSIADLQSKIASKTTDLHNAEQRLSEERSKQEDSRRAEELKHEKTLTKEVRTRRNLQMLQDRLALEFPDYETSLYEEEDIKYDVFISHASQDKEGFVEPLASLLSDMGFEVWYDDFVLKVGDSLRRDIDKGIANSEYGLVVLSPHFFAKGWTERELDGLTAREVAGRRKLILPIWHNVGQEDVLEYSPALADKVALDTRKMGLEEIAEAIAEVLPGRMSPEEEDRLDVEEAERILSDPTEERISWEVLRNETTG